MAITDIWSWRNYVDGPGVSIVATPANPPGAYLNLGNLRDPRVGKIWRASGSPTTLDVSLPTPKRIGVVGLFGLSVAGLTALRVKIGITPGGGEIFDKTYNAGSIQRDMLVSLPRDSAGEPTVALGQYVQVYSPGAPLQIGRLWVGDVDFAPSVSHATNGSSWGVKDLSIKTTTPRTGAVLADVASTLRMFTANYDALQPEEYSVALQDIDLEVGVSGQILFVPRIDVYQLSRHPILGTLETTEQTTFVGFLRARRELTILECG